MRRQGQTDGEDFREDDLDEEEQRQQRVRRAVRRLGLSYLRFSDPKQGQGDSEGRQDRDFRRFCQRHNLTPLREVYADRGRSGYHDEHRKKGRLGELIAAARNGSIEKGTVIVVEAWDRLGRLRPDKQTKLVAELLETGVAIGICRLDDIFTEEDFGTHKWTTLAVFIQLAYQESKQKAERVAESYDTRRKLAREGKPMPPRKKDGRITQTITDRLPAWLRTDPVSGKIVPIPERKLAIKRILELSAEGYGGARLARQLAREDIAPFGTARWTVPYLNKILNDERVLGRYQPRHTDDSPAGEVVEGYYPAGLSSVCRG
jgi:DNA invertase Pin-like site-specific DNA recombinase